jgi:hypothetical protein
VRRWSLLAAVVVLAVAVAGCGGSSTKTVTVSTTGKKGKAGKVKAPPVTDAAAVRDRLLKLAKKHASDQAGSNASFGVSEAWHKKFPKLQFVGFAEAADSKTVSGYQFNARNSKDPASKSNPLVLAFAVADTKGGCAGGVIEGFPKPDTTKAVDMAGATACTGTVVATKAGL